MNNLKQFIIDIQDHLAPQLDPFEQMLYHYLFRHTHLAGNRTTIIAARSISPDLGKGRKSASELSRNSVPRKLRSLEEKGAIRILNRSMAGTEIEVFLPNEIPGLICRTDNIKPVDIENVNFFTTPENRERIFLRDKHKCGYCGRKLDSKNASIDHIAPQANGMNDSFRNLIAACFECNSRKHSQNAEEFLRDNYRRGLLSATDFEICLAYLRRICAGEIVPP